MAFRVLMEGEQKALTTETVCGSVSGKFQNKFHFAFDSVTPKLLDFLQTQGLQLELWGTQSKSAGLVNALDLLSSLGAFCIKRCITPVQGCLQGASTDAVIIGWN